MPADEAVVPEFTADDLALGEALLDTETFIRWAFTDGSPGALSDQQSELIGALEQHRLVALQKGHSTGGTWAVCAWILAKLAQHERVKVITTGPTWETVTKITFWQLREHIRAARGKYEFPEPNEAFLDMSGDGPARFALGLSTNDVNRFSGHKAPLVIVVLEEAAGVHADVWSGIDGLRASGEVHVIALSQPHSPVGPFHDACESPNFHNVVMDCFDSPNLKGLTEADLRGMAADDPRLDVVVHPALVTRRWVWEMMSELSPAEWQVKVRGQFPAEDEHALFPLSLLYGARDRPVLPYEGTVCAGLDVAGGGRNATVLTILGGDNILAVHRWKESDPRGKVLVAIEPWRDRLKAIGVDAIGVGHYMAKHLLDAKLPVKAINVSLPSTWKPERFLNERARGYFRLRDRMKTMRGLTDKATISQLSAITNDPDSRGRNRIVSKKKLRIHGLESPDEADSLMNAVLVSPDEAQQADVDRLIRALTDRVQDRRLPEEPGRMDKWRSL